MDETEVTLTPKFDGIVNPLLESFYLNNERLTHQIDLGTDTIQSSIPCPSQPSQDLKGAWWKAYMEGVSPEPDNERCQTLTTVDLFCGAGGLALGLNQLCREIGINVVAEAIVDQDKEATRVYAANHQVRFSSSKSVSSLIDYTIQGEGSSAKYLYAPELLDEVFEKLVGQVDIVLAGPPCKGHSNLNNSTRRDDRRNALYLTVPAVAIALGAPIVIIENVPEVVHDSSKVVQTSQRLLTAAGYKITSETLSASDMGWPQSRRRHFLVACKGNPPLDLDLVSLGLRDDLQRSLWWAIGDLEGSTADNPMNSVTELSPENRRRINWLFENDEYDLALPQRPESHKGGTTYTAVYGRLKKNEPCPTLTTGFLSPGRGRFTHPTERRVLTPHEAARLQGFPDSFKFAVHPDREPYRGELAKWIGDAVPMPLGYAASLAALGSNLKSSSY